MSRQELHPLNGNDTRCTANAHRITNPGQRICLCRAVVGGEHVTGPVHGSRQGLAVVRSNGAACLGERIATTPGAQRTRTVSFSQARGSAWIA